MTKLFVRIGGLDRSVSKEDRIALIQSIFEGIAEVDPSNVIAITDKEYGGFRNFMFVSIVDDTQAQAVISQLDNVTTEEGYQLNINEAKPMDDKPRGGGGFGGGNRGGYQGGGRSNGGYNKGGNRDGGSSNNESY
jgi:hypothetical protein